MILEKPKIYETTQTLNKIPHLNVCTIVYLLNEIARKGRTEKKCNCFSRLVFCPIKCYYSCLLFNNTLFSLLLVIYCCCCCLLLHCFVLSIESLTQLNYNTEFFWSLHSYLYVEYLLFIVHKKSNAIYLSKLSFRDVV